MTWRLQVENWARKTKQAYELDSQQECVNKLGEIMNQTGDRYFKVSERVWEAYTATGRFENRYACAVILEIEDQFNGHWYGPPVNPNQRYCWTGDHDYHKRDQQPGCACCRHCFQTWPPKDREVTIARYGDWGFQI